MQNDHNRIDVKKINELLLTSPKELVALSERRYYEQLERVAAKIVQERAHCSILLMSGPSASTKTTTAMKLSQELSHRGIHAVVISLDNFFVDRKDLPVLENGDVDFESVNTLDMPVLNHCFEELLTKRESNFPLFDFPNGCRSENTQHITVNDDSVVIVEGIHALNPLIAQEHDKNSFLKLYVSPNSDYYIGDDLILSARNTRFVRRLVRDFFHRGNPIESTMQMWVNVVKSEMVNIMPYKTEADFRIDSTIMYEPSIYENYLSKLMKVSDVKNESYIQRLEDIVKSLARFYELDLCYLPKDSVLHEFLE